MKAASSSSHPQQLGGSVTTPSELVSTPGTGGADGLERSYLDSGGDTGRSSVLSLSHELPEGILEHFPHLFHSDLQPQPPSTSAETAAAAAAGQQPQPNELAATAAAMVVSSPTPHAGPSMWLVTHAEPAGRGGSGGGLASMQPFPSPPPLPLATDSLFGSHFATAAAISGASAFKSTTPLNFSQLQAQQQPRPAAAAASTAVSLSQLQLLSDVSLSIPHLQQSQPQQPQVIEWWQPPPNPEPQQQPPPPPPPAAPSQQQQPQQSSNSSPPPLSPLPHPSLHLSPSVPPAKPAPAKPAAAKPGPPPKPPKLKPSQNQANRTNVRKQNRAASARVATVAAAAASTPITATAAPVAVAVSASSSSSAAAAAAAAAAVTVAASSSPPSLASSSSSASLLTLLPAPSISSRSPSASHKKSSVILSPEARQLNQEHKALLARQSRIRKKEYTVLLEERVAQHEQLLQLLRQPPPSHSAAAASLHVQHLEAEIHRVSSLPHLVSPYPAGSSYARTPVKLEPPAAVVATVVYSTPSHRRHGSASSSYTPVATSHASTTAAPAAAAAAAAAAPAPLPLPWQHQLLLQQPQQQQQQRSPQVRPSSVQQLSSASQARIVSAPSVLMHEQQPSPSSSRVRSRAATPLEECASPSKKGRVEDGSRLSSRLALHHEQQQLLQPSVRLPSALSQPALYSRQVSDPMPDLSQLGVSSPHASLAAAGSRSVGSAEPYFQWNSQWQQQQQHQQASHAAESASSHSSLPDTPMRDRSVAASALAPLFSSSSSSLSLPFSSFAAHAGSNLAPAAFSSSSFSFSGANSSSRPLQLQDAAPSHLNSIFSTPGAPAANQR